MIFLLFQLTGLRLAPEKAPGGGQLSADYAGGKGDPSENWSTISLNSSAHTTPASYKKGSLLFNFINSRAFCFICFASNFLIYSNYLFRTLGPFI